MIPRVGAIVATVALAVVTGCSTDDGEGLEGGPTTGTPGSESGDGTTTSDGVASSDRPDSTATSATSMGDGGGSDGSDSGSSSEPPGPPGTGCQRIDDAWQACGVQGGYDPAGCVAHLFEHPAVEPGTACEAALDTRLRCYAPLGCDVVSQCGIWGCIGDDPCAEWTQLVNETCVRTSCEQWFDATNACGLPSDISLPTLCQYIQITSQIDAEIAGLDVVACGEAFDARAVCWAELPCAQFDDCDILSGCTDPTACAQEQKDFDLACGYA